MDARKAAWPRMFSVDHWGRLIQSLKGAGYVVANYATYVGGVDGARICLLRHDIEDAPERALLLARVEAAESVRASYFARVHGRYNPLAPEVIGVLRAIDALGHEVGLHMEPGDFSAAFGEPALDIVNREKAVLEVALGRPVRSVAPHGDWTRLHVRWPEVRRSNGLVRYEQSALRVGTRKPLVASWFRATAEALRDTLWRWGLNVSFRRHARGTDVGSWLDYRSLGFAYSTTEDRFVTRFRHFGDGEGHFRPFDPLLAVGRSPRMIVNAHPHWWFQDFYHLGAEQAVSWTR